jgi:hypothetical protein
MKAILVTLEQIPGETCCATSRPRNIAVMAAEAEALARA